MGGIPLDEDQRRRLGIIVPDGVIAERVAKWHDHSGVQGVIWDLSSSHGASMTGTTLNYYGDIHTLGELASKTDAELQAIRRLGPVGMGLVREVLRLWRARQADSPAAAAGEGGQQDGLPRFAAPRAPLDFPAASPVAGPGRPTSARRRRLTPENGTARRGKAPGGSR